MIQLGSMANFIDFEVACEQVGVAVPDAIARGSHVAEVLQQHLTRSRGPLIEMTTVDVANRYDERVLALSDLHGEVAVQMNVELAYEVRAAVLPTLDDMVAELQPTFERLSTPIVDAVHAYRFTSSTTSDQVIELADNAAADAWRAARKAQGQIGPIVNLRLEMSTLFGASPTPEETATYSGDWVSTATDWDMSVCFAAGDNWTWDGSSYSAGRPGTRVIDWMQLAVGGLRLNTPSETRAKQHDRWDASPHIPLDLYA